MLVVVRHETPFLGGSTWPCVWVCNFQWSDPVYWFIQTQHSSKSSHAQGKPTSVSQKYRANAAAYTSLLVSHKPQTRYKVRRPDSSFIKLSRSLKWVLSWIWTPASIVKSFITIYFYIRSKEKERRSEILILYSSMQLQHAHTHTQTHCICMCIYVYI